MTSYRPLVRFLRAPKGLLLIVLIGLLAVASLELDAISSRQR